MSWKGRLVLLLVMAAGLAVAAYEIGVAGFAQVLAAAARLGISGLLVYCAYSAGVFVILGAAWRAAAPGAGAASLARFSWARAVREAAADLLPFSQIGGIVFGARTLTERGMAARRVYASLIVDMTTELASQLMFTLFGVAMAATIMTGAGQRTSVWPLVLGALVLTAIIALLFAGQRWLPAITGRLLGHGLPGSAGRLDGLSGELARIYTHRGHVLLAFALNLAAWIASAGGAWIVLRLMGAPVSIWTILTLESLIFTLRSVAFAIPGGIGVQEASYALLGPALGLPLDLVVALALAKRARDLALGVPTLVLWQAIEARGVFARRPSRDPA